MANTRLWVFALLIESLWLAVIFLGQRGERIIETIVLLLLLAAAALPPAYFVMRRQPGPGIPFIILTAVMFRLTAWTIPPTFSDDIYRYRWEGKLQAHGGNPYTITPNDPRFSHLRDGTYAWIPGHEVRAVYGPVLESIERAWYPAVNWFTTDVFRQVHWFKLPYALAELLTLLLLVYLAGERVILYAWFPLPVWEFWANGHNDSIAVFFILAGTAFLGLGRAGSSRDGWAFASLTMAAAAKLWPVLLLPLFLARSRRKIYVLTGIPILLALAWPYWSDVSLNIRFTSGFLGGWRNNDSLFGLIAWLLPDSETSRWVTLALAGAWAVYVATRAWPLATSAARTIAGLLLLSANCHPWYLSWFLPFLVFAPSFPLLLWSSLMPLSYTVLFDWRTNHIWNGSTAIRWYVYVPVALVASALWLKKRANPTDKEVEIIESSQVRAPADFTRQKREPAP